MNEKSRSHFESQSLGLDKLTDGRCSATFIRSVGNMQIKPNFHFHDTNFQIVHVIKGWIEFTVNGGARICLREGDSVHQQSGVVHTVTDVSEDMELIEVLAPADFTTTEAPAAGDDAGAGAVVNCSYVVQGENKIYFFSNEPNKLSN